jgi:23S rRNA (guanosine2251-2'-O)-methyltransferase
VKEWITGRNPVYETLRAKRRQCFHLVIASGAEEKGRLQEIIHMAQERRVATTYVQRQQLDNLAENHQGVALEASGYPYSDLQTILQEVETRQEPMFILALDVIQNPQNLGTLLRSAEAVGVQGVLMPLARAAGVTPAVVTASAGASEHLLVASINLSQALNTLKEEGAWVIGLEGGHDSIPAEKVNLKGPLVLVVGSEGEGMRLLTRKSCDVLLKLPMHGQIESLNAAVAGSIVLYMALMARKTGTAPA